MVNHHPAPELLAAYSAGSLPLSHALCIATHVESCPECKANLQRLNSLGAQVFSEAKPSNASDYLKDSVMAMLDEKRPAEAHPISASAKVISAAENQIDMSSVPKALRHLVPEGYDSLDWQRVSPSVSVAELCKDTNGAQVSLLKIKPGGQVGKHRHTGDEFTQLLSGSFSDESGLYKQGDFLFRDSKSHGHRPIATNDAECLCLTVVDAPIEFTGFFTRVLNPLLRKKYA